MTSNTRGEEVTETDFQRARRLMDYCVISICECCMIIHANGESTCDPMYFDDEGQCQHSRGMVEQLAAGTHHLTLGVTTDECHHDLSDDDQAEAHSQGCERQGFRWDRCDLCRVDEGGDRYVATLWPIYTEEGKANG